MLDMFEGYRVGAGTMPIKIQQVTQHQSRSSCVSAYKQHAEPHTNTHTHTHTHTHTLTVSKLWLMTVNNS